MASSQVGKQPSRAPVAVRDLRPGEVLTAVGAIARGMQDNPVHVAAYGGDAHHRCRAHGRMVARLFAVSPSMQLLGCRRGIARAGTRRRPAARAHKPARRRRPGRLSGDRPTRGGWILRAIRLPGGGQCSDPRSAELADATSGCASHAIPERWAMMASLWQPRHLTWPQLSHPGKTVNTLVDGTRYSPFWSRAVCLSSSVG